MEYRFYSTDLTIANLSKLIKKGYQQQNSTIQKNTQEKIILVNTFLQTFWICCEKSLEDAKKITIEEFNQTIINKCQN